MKNCRLLNKYIFSKIGIIKPEIVVLSAYWINYGNRISNLELTISKIKELSPHSKILVVGTFPIWGRGLQKMLIAKNKPLHNNYLRPPRFIDQLKFDLKLRDRVLTAGGIYLSALNTMCPNNLRCLTASKDAKDNWRLTTYDYGHLTDIGAVIIAQSLKSLISE